MSKDNLLEMFGYASLSDINEGLKAYHRYHEVMQCFSRMYRVDLDKTIAAFVSLSPNNDYQNNLRSLASVLGGYKTGKSPDEITISTYGHCKERAWAYVTGERDFLDCTKGLKVRSFYFNIFNPDSGYWVTVDGHIKATWDSNPKMVMKEAAVGRSEYFEIQNCITEIAIEKGMLPHQFQAILWFVRKRRFNIKYDPQHELFGDPSDTWRTMVNVEDIKPFERKPQKPIEAKDQPKLFV